MVHVVHLCKSKMNCFSQSSVKVKFTKLGFPQVNASTKTLATVYSEGYFEVYLPSCVGTILETCFNLATTIYCLQIEDEPKQVKQVYNDQPLGMMA